MQNNDTEKKLVLPLKTSLNSPGGACKMKSEAILTWKQWENTDSMTQT